MLAWEWVYHQRQSGDNVDNVAELHVLDEFVGLRMATSFGYGIAMQLCDWYGFERVSVATLQSLIANGDRFIMSPGPRDWIGPLYLYTTVGTFECVMSKVDPATREAWARTNLAYADSPSFPDVNLAILEVSRWSRLRQALRPFEMTIKRRACVRLDEPKVGTRFIREHGAILSGLP